MPRKRTPPPRTKTVSAQQYMGDLGDFLGTLALRSSHGGLDSSVPQGPPTPWLQSKLARDRATLEAKAKADALLNKPSGLGNVVPNLVRDYHAAVHGGEAVVQAVPKVGRAIAGAAAPVSAGIVGTMSGRPTAGKKTLPTDLGPAITSRAVAGAETAGAIGLETAGALNRAKNQFALGLRRSSDPGTAQTSEAGLLPSHALGQIGPVTAKLAAGGAGSLYSLRHPSTAVPEIVDGIWKTLVGLGLGTVGAGVTAFDPNTSFHQKRQIVDQMSAAVLKPLIDAYGPDVPISEAFQKAQKDPFFYGSNLLFLLDPAARAISLVHNVATGATLGEAWGALRIPLKERTLNIRVKGGEPKPVSIEQAQNPLYRGTVSLPYDVISKGAGKVPGLRRLPIAETPRAARALRRQMNRQEHRMGAEAMSIFRDARGYLKANKHDRVAAALLVQKPNGFTDEEWLRANLAELQNMLEHPGRFTSPGEHPSPGVLRLLKRVKSYAAKEEAARTQRLGRANVRIADEQTRLASSLDEINHNRSVLTQQRDEIAKSDLPQAELDGALAEVDQQIRGLNAQAKVARQELDDLTVEQPPVDHPARTQLIEQATAAGVDPAHIEDAVAALDAHARAAHANPADFYQGLETQTVGDVSQIPGESLLQRGVQPVQGLDVAALTAEARGIFGRYSKLGGSMPPGVKSYRDFAARGVELARLARAGARHRRWYTDSGKAIRAEISPRGVALTDAQWEDAIKISKAVAYLSRTDAVVPNVGHALRAFNEWKRSGEKDVGLAGRYPNNARTALNKIFAEKGWGGYKTNAFFRNILEEVDKRRYNQMFKGEEPVTVDRWVVRALGHTDDSVGQKGRYLSSQEMVQHIAKQFGWTPKETQAALWVGIKAERAAAKDALKKGERNAKGRAAHDAKVARAQKAGRPAPADFVPETPRTAQDFLGESGAHVGTGIERTTHQLRLNYEVAPGNTYDGFPEFATWSTPVQEAFARDVAEGVHELYFRGLGVPFSPGHEGPGIWEPATGPIETNLGLSVNVRAGSSMRGPTAAKYGVDRVSAEQRAYYDGIAAGLGAGLKQNAQPWLKPLVAEDINDATAIFVERPNLTKEEMLALRAARGDENWQIALSHGDGGVWITLVKDAGMDTAAFRERAGTMVDAAFGSETEHVLRNYAHEGGYIENDWGRGDSEYQARIGDSGRPGEIRGASAALADHYERTRLEYARDPEGAAARSGQQRAAGQRPTLAPVRQQDVRGAIQWLDSEAGKRILYLVNGKADGSTILHELVGHSVEEMRRLHPQEFAAVEQFRGKALADWNTADHEWFAQQAERFFMSGVAPTPELVPVFQQTKGWMRSIYGGALGPRLAPETRILFDTYLGAYDDVNVARVAMNMGREGWGREDLGIQRWGDAKVVSQQELRTLKKSIETRRYNRSLDGMVNKLDEMTKALDDLWKNRETWSLDDQAEYNRLSADVLTQQAEIVVRQDRREQNLRRKIHDLEKTLEKGTEGKGFQGAVDAMKWLADDREKILREAFGNKYDEVFAGRRDLLADWLVSRGLLKAEFERGTAHYYPMQLEPAYLRHGVSGPAAPLEGTVIGKTKMDLLKLHKHNQMILWQRGDWTADPAVLMQAHQRAQGYAWMNHVKQTLHDVGRPLSRAEANSPPKDAFLINLTGTPVGIELRTALRGAGRVEDSHTVHDGLAGDQDALESSLKTYWDSFAIDGNHLPVGFDPTTIPDLRVVPKSVVRAILRPLKGGGSAGGEAWDWGTTIARLGLIYSNVPGYMITNSVGNLAFLLAQQGFRFPGALRDMKTILGDRKLLDLIAGETGDLPAMAAISRGRGFSDTFQKGEEHLLTFESVVDRYPRALAWVYEARKRGYKTPTQMRELLKGETAKTARDREFVSSTATNHLIDFNRLSPYERNVLTRVLFIWPFVRGATAWPFWYAKNYPLRAALGVNYGLAQYNRQQEMLGPVPSWYSDLYPISRNGERAQVVRTSATSPTSMAADSVRLISDTVASLLGRQPDTQTMDLVNNFSPILRDVLMVATQKNSFGQDQSLRKTLETDGLQLVPGWRLGKALFGSSDTPRVFKKYDRGQKDQIVRTFVRIAPQTVTVPWLNAQAQRRGSMTTQQKIDQALSTSKAQFAKVNPKEVYSQYVDRAVRMKVVYDDRLTELAREKAKAPDFVPSKTEGGTWDVKYAPTAYERAVVAHAVLGQYYPAADIPDPNTVLSQAGLSPTSEEAQQWMKKYLTLTWDKYIKPANQVSSQASKVTTYEKIRAEQKGKKKAAA